MRGRRCVGKALAGHHNSVVLEPGDLLNSGTPQGVALSGRYPYLADGDVVDLEIDYLGAQRQSVVPAPVPARSSETLRR